MKQETIDQILKFRDDRDWKQFHNPKDLAISIVLEASELLEVFQWSGEDTSSSNKIEKIIFGQEDYIQQHTNVTCHMPVNVYYEPSSLYEVRKDDMAVDIQINEQFR